MTNPLSPLLCYTTNEVVLEPEGEDNLIQLQVKAVFISLISLLHVDIQWRHNK